MSAACTYCVTRNTHDRPASFFFFFFPLWMSTGFPRMSRPQDVLRDPFEPAAATTAATTTPLPPGFPPEIHTTSMWGGTTMPHPGLPPAGSSGGSDLLTLDLRALGITEREMREALAVLNQNRHMWGITEPITTVDQALRALQAHPQAPLYPQAQTGQPWVLRPPSPPPPPPPGLGKVLREAGARWRYNRFGDGREEWKQRQRERREERRRRGDGEEEEVVEEGFW
ncbi:hypothetical protein MN608_00342 [Microdochium nivale]|nr:hypothetical protein MN608_00342 [Microdochium nivale]